MMAGSWGRLPFVAGIESQATLLLDLTQDGFVLKNRPRRRITRLVASTAAPAGRGRLRRGQRRLADGW